MLLGKLAEPITSTGRKYLIFFHVKRKDMLSDKIRKRAEYLSSHFGDKQCRDELRQLIDNFIKNEKKQES